MIPKFLGTNYFRINLGFSLMNIINVPLIAATYIRVNGSTLFETVPWYVIVISAGICVVSLAWVFGYVLVWSKVIEHQTKVGTDENPQIVKILQDLEEIKSKL